MVRLTLADHDLQSVAEGDEPALAAQGAQLADMADVDQCVAVNSLEVVCGQSLFDAIQGLSGQKALFRRDDPYQFAFRLKGENLVRIEDHLISAVAGYNLAARVGPGRFRRRGDLGGVVGDLQGLVAKAAGTFYRLLQARVLHGLQQIVDSAGLKRLDGVLVEGRDDDDDGHVFTGQLAYYFETAHDRHLQIEKDQFRPEFLDLLQRRSAVVCLADHFDVRKQFEPLPEHTPRNRLVINDQCLHSAPFHLYLKNYLRLT